MPGNLNTLEHQAINSLNCMQAACVCVCAWARQICCQQTVLHVVCMATYILQDWTWYSWHRDQLPVQPTPVLQLLRCTGTCTVSHVVNEHGLRRL
jgi:hypothetical protein